MFSDFPALLVLIAIWYWVVAFTESDGPFDLFEHLRNARFIGGLFSCYICLSVWVSGAVFLMWLYAPPLLVISAMAGVFLLLYRAMEFVGSEFQVISENNHHKRAKDVAKLLTEHTTLSDDFRNDVVRFVLEGYPTEIALLKAHKDWYGEPDA